MTTEEIRSIVETTVAETMNHLEHDYDIPGMEGVGSPTITEITDAIIAEHFSEVTA